MATYQTEQKRELLDFLRRNSQRAFTIEELLAGMKADPLCTCPPGKSTLYRLIPRLLAENTLRRFPAVPAADGLAGRKATYQILGGSSCHCHVHLKCSACGRLFHASDELTEKLKDVFAGSEGFALDAEETIIYGRCRSCAKKEK